MSHWNTLLNPGYRESEYPNSKGHFTMWFTRMQSGIKQCTAHRSLCNGPSLILVSPFQSHNFRLLLVLLLGVITHSDMSNLNDSPFLAPKGNRTIKNIIKHNIISSYSIIDSLCNRLAENIPSMWLEKWRILLDAVPWKTIYSKYSCGFQFKLKLIACLLLLLSFGAGKLKIHML